jgi:hypothetical protein
MENLIQLKTCEGFQNFQWKDGGLIRLEDMPSESSEPDSSVWREAERAMLRDWPSVRRSLRLLSQS